MDECVDNWQLKLLTTTFLLLVQFSEMGGVFSVSLMSDQEMETMASRSPAEVCVDREEDGESEEVKVSLRVAQQRVEEELRKEQQLSQQLKTSAAKQVSYISKFGTHEAVTFWCSMLLLDGVFLIVAATLHYMCLWTM